MKYQVIGWTNYDNRKYPAFNGRIEEYVAARNAIIDELREKGFRFSGDYHQYGDSGCPILNDGTCFTVSSREWGAIMAEALYVDNSDGFAYMEWYMDSFSRRGEERDIVYPSAGVDDSKIVDKSVIEVPSLPKVENDANEDCKSGLENFKHMIHKNNEAIEKLNLKTIAYISDKGE